MLTLIATLLPVLIPLAEHAILGAEAIFHSKPSSGKDKFPTVLDIVKAGLAGLAKAQVIPGVPSDPELATIVQTVFDNLNAKGKVNNAKGQPVPPSERILVLVDGWKIVGSI